MKVLIERARHVFWRLARNHLLLYAIGMYLMIYGTMDVFESNLGGWVMFDCNPYLVAVDGASFIYLAIAEASLLEKS